MDDKSYSETQANSETAPTLPPGALPVSATGSADASRFSNCYFMVSGTNWSLYNNGGHLLQSGSSSQTGFTFNHDALHPGQPNSPQISWTISSCTYTVTNNVITAIAGSWSNNDTSVKRGAQSGSFTASSGGTIDPLTASASASAK